MSKRKSARYIVTREALGRSLDLAKTRYGDTQIFDSIEAATFAATKYVKDRGGDAHVYRCVGTVTAEATFQPEEES